MRHLTFVALLIGSLLLSACNVLLPSAPPTATTAPVLPATATVTAAPSDTAAPTDTAVPSDTAAPSATTAPSDTPVPAATTAAPTTAPSDTPAPAATTAAPATAGPTAGPAASATAAPTAGAVAYIDDRSTAASVLTSYVSALNLHQYLRAYWYWNPQSPQLPSYQAFQSGFTNTQLVQLTVGAVKEDPGAGQLYFAAPVTLVAQTTSSGTQTFVGCYILHLSQPGIQGAPPFHPLSIESAQVNQVANNADTASLMAQACQSQGGSLIPATPVPDPNDITPTRYLDDRTDAIQAIRSLFNAVNRQEYVRAYSYWEANAVGLPAYNQFQQGYASTKSVQLTFGTMTTGAGAGQRYYSVPVVLVATTTASATQTFVACYILHLGLPDAQGVPPYQPIGIRSATVKSVANNADTATMLAQACPAQ